MEDTTGKGVLSGAALYLPLLSWCILLCLFVFSLVSLMSFHPLLTTNRLLGGVNLWPGVARLCIKESKALAASLMSPAA